METMTPNTEVAPVPQVSSTQDERNAEFAKLQAGASPAKLKAIDKAISKASKRKPATDKVADAVKQAVATWKHGVAPDGLPDGLRVMRYGQETGKVNKLGDKLHSRSLTIQTPTAKQLRDLDPSLSVADAQAKSNDIGQTVKPMLMARVGAAGASSNYIVRRYSETPNDKGKHKLAVTLERVAVEDTLERIARELKLTREEVAKRLGVAVKPLSIDV